ncbi:MAG: N-acetylmuramic acid 6-phosphate etherase [Candidatus Limiplasma sp.]|nr:N-acetylmuramic acid 6-phosphate etherase [Candidatus Limiplasma sp.]
MEARSYLSGLTTEQINAESAALDTLDGQAIAALMNRQDYGVVEAVARAVPVIGRVIDEIAARFSRGGRLFYTGAGTSGRLGVLDASECPPTFGVPSTMVQGIIAGGDIALRHAVEGAEDDYGQGREDLKKAGLGRDDVVVAISASGYAPYCVGGLDYARSVGALAVSLACNEHTELARHADLAIEAPTGPEVLMGSTRLKAGTATKMILNMLTTGAMVRTGRVYQNLMVDLCISNSKLSDRALRILRHATGVEEETAAQLLKEAGGSVKTAIVMHLGGADASQARQALEETGGWVGPAIEKLKS